MTVVSWVLGWLATAVGVSAVVLTARCLRRRLLPTWSGPPAVLAASVLGVAVVLVVAQVLGAVGLLRRETLLAASVVLLVGSLLWWRRDGQAGAVGEDDAPPTIPRAEGQWSVIAAVVGIAGLAVSWLAYVVSAYHRGNDDGDSLMYHLPFAVRFVQSGWTTRVIAVGPDPWISFYPASVEVITATAMLPFHHDVLIPLLNLGWMALALLAGWCLGALAGRPALGSLLVAFVLAAPVMASTQAGSARGDVACLALLVAAVALVAHQPRTVGSCAVAGLALGAALGTKLNLLPLALLLLVGIAAVLWRRDGRRPMLAWSGAALALGSYWYLRNWVVAGNPVPVVGRLGPFRLPSLPEDRLDDFDDTSILHHLGTPGFVRGTLLPGVSQITGGSKPLLAVLCLVVVVTALVVLRRRPVDVPHVVAVAGLIGLVVYVTAPNGAPIAGGGGVLELTIVGLNTRYALPSLVLLLGLVPMALGARPSRQSDLVAGAVAVLVLALAVKSTVDPLQELVTAADIAIAVGVGVGAALAGAWWLGSHRRSPPLLDRRQGVALAMATAALVVVALGSRAVVQEPGYHSYWGAPGGYAALWAAGRDLDGDRVGVIGDWVQYPYSADDLTRVVEYLGRRESHGVVIPPTSCDDVHLALDGRAYDLAVVQRGLYQPVGALTEMAQCLQTVGGAELVFENDAGVIVDLGPSAT